MRRYIESLNELSDAELNEPGLGQQLPTFRRVGEIIDSLEAKANRDRVRDCIVKALRAGADAEEIAALLAADAIASTTLAQAMGAHQ